MSFSISLAALLALATTAQVPAVDAKSAAIVPFVGDETILAAHFDLARWDGPTSFRRIFGKLADDADLAEATRGFEGWVASLKKAGADDLYLVVDLADMPGLPVVVVPLAGKADGRAVADLLTSGPVPWPASEIIRGSVVAGSPAAMARIKDARPSGRPELMAGLANSPTAPIQLAISPSLAQRRALEETMPNLSAPLGGGPITDVTRGMTWASVTLTTDPAPTVRFLLRGKDGDSAKALRKLAQDGLDQLAKFARSNPPIAEMAEAIARLKPEVTGTGVAVEADLEKAASLVSVPIRQFREAAHRSDCVNHLKQIGLAMHNYHSTHNTFPPAYLAAKDGKPLLSWRVLILPFLEQKELYDQFHLDEPWDGPHNKALIARMPKTYACASGSKALVAEGKTTYLTPRGTGSMFPGAQAIKIQEITDGTSNTFIAVDASDEAAVIWTRPGDWEIASKFTIQGLFGHHPQGTNFLFGDGSVQFLKETIKLAVLQALATRDGGEVISADDY